MFLLAKNLNIELFSPECAVPMDFWQKYFAKMTIPLILFALMFTSFILRQHCLKFFKLRTWPTMSFVASMKIKAHSMFSFLIVTLFTFCVSSVLQPFNCIRQFGGFVTLAKYPNVKCYDEEWKSHLGGVMFFVVLYIVAVPGFLIFTFYRNRQSIESPEFLQKFPNLISPYRRNFFYYELIMMLRKALFVVSNDFLSVSGDYFSRFFVTISLLCFYLWLDFSFAPFQNQEMNYLQARFVFHLMFLSSSKLPLVGIW
jgi:hypothetical protein